MNSDTFHKVLKITLFIFIGLANIMLILLLVFGFMLMQTYFELRSSLC